MSNDFIGCTVRQLPDHQLLMAAAEAVAENPVNRAPAEKLHRVMDFVLAPAHLAVLVTKYWNAGGVDLPVYFGDTKDAALKRKILSFMNRWSPRANIQFRESADKTSWVRLLREPGQGYYAYLGTDIKLVPVDEQTINLDSFSLNTPDGEYLRVVPHEAGHLCGFPHEHMRRELVERLNPERTIAYFLRVYGWGRDETVQQVLTPIDEALLKATPHADALSIMTYQLSGECTNDGKPIPGGLDIDETDFLFAGKVYPKPQPPPPPAGKLTLTIPQDLRAGNYTLTLE
jgi:hypothetical protein